MLHKIGCMFACDSGLVIDDLVNVLEEGEVVEEQEVAGMSTLK